MLSINERISIVLFMSELKSVILVKRKLQHLDWKNVPSERTIRDTFNRFKETGSVEDRARQGRPSKEEERKQILGDSLKENSNTSIRRLCSETGYSYGSVQSTLRVGLKLFPYKIQVHQGLSDEDCASRVQMSQDLLSLMDENDQFVKQIIFSDEATFRLNGNVNRHNCRIWGSTPPTETIKKIQGGAKVNVWIGISYSKVYGPYFFDDNITSVVYLDMLKKCFVPALSRNTKRNCIFQQDGAPAHYGTIVRNYLDATFPNRWIGRSGHMAWAARSPDLSPLDYFVWGYLKDSVYKRKPNNLASLKTFIEEDCLNMREEFVQNAVLSFESRLKICIENEGSSVEHY